MVTFIWHRWTQTVMIQMNTRSYDTLFNDIEGHFFFFFCMTRMGIRSYETVGHTLFLHRWIHFLTTQRGTLSYGRDGLTFLWHWLTIFHHKVFTLFMIQVGTVFMTQIGKLSNDTDKLSYLKQMVPLSPMDIHYIYLYVSVIKLGVLNMQSNATIRPA